MNAAWVSAMLVRDLKTLAREIEAYPDEHSLWTVVPGITTPGGNLALHLVGNLQHFVGAQLGRTGYVRNRDAEFAVRGTSRKELLALVNTTIGVVESTFAKLTPVDLESQYPLTVGNVRVKTADYLIHLAVHFAYHLGQIDYHRRMVTRQPGAVGAVAVAQLATAEPAAA
ncbi:MAG: DUF1572 family protein [Gemmatimonadetes bacterium]|nr:DUF1572 family protein [Gemmatimonadota bacterium]